MTCPDCKSNQVSSKGYREGTKNKRYVCKVCGRNFTIKGDSPMRSEKQIVKIEEVKPTVKPIEEPKTEEKIKVVLKTLNVKESTKISLEGMKMYPRETIDDILVRLITNYKVTTPV
jgi:uncharacterized protein YbaR (Trm112 family)